MLTVWCRRKVKLYGCLSCTLVCDPATSEHYAGSVSKLQGVHPARVATPGNGIRAPLPYVSEPGPQQAIGWPRQGNLRRPQLLPPHREQRVDILSPGVRGSPGWAGFPLPSAGGPARPLAAAALRSLFQSGLFPPAGRERFLTPLGSRSAGGPSTPRPPFRRRGGRERPGAVWGLCAALPGNAPRLFASPLSRAERAPTVYPRADPAGERALTSRAALRGRGGAASLRRDVTSALLGPSVRRRRGSAGGGERSRTERHGRRREAARRPAEYVDDTFRFGKIVISTFIKV